MSTREIWVVYGLVALVATWTVWTVTRAILGRLEGNRMSTLEDWTLQRRLENAEAEIRRLRQRPGALEPDCAGPTPAEQAQQLAERILGERL